jgi:phage baseplate assembly protein W
MAQMGREFLGTGWNFPITVTPGVGHLALVNEDASIQQAIWIILSTAPGERLMHPEFGCAIHTLVFAPNNASTAGLARFHVQEALNRWEPRIIVDEVEVQADPARPEFLLISVTYQVRTTDSRFNLVYPFYLTRG